MTEERKNEGRTALPRNFCVVCGKPRGGDEPELYLRGHACRDCVLRVRKSGNERRNWARQVKADLHRELGLLGARGQPRLTEEQIRARELARLRKRGLVSADGKLDVVGDELTERYIAERDALLASLARLKANHENALRARDKRSAAAADADEPGEATREVVKSDERGVLCAHQSYSRDDDMREKDTHWQGLQLPPESS